MRQPISIVGVVDFTIYRNGLCYVKISFVFSCTYNYEFCNC